MAILDTTDVVALASQYAVDLSGEEWVKECVNQTTQVDGKIVGLRRIGRNDCDRGTAGRQAAHIQRKCQRFIGHLVRLILISKSTFIIALSDIKKSL